jgi:hypothetical protein
MICKGCGAPVIYNKCEYCGVSNEKTTDAYSATKINGPPISLIGSITSYPTTLSYLFPYSTASSYKLEEPKLEPRYFREGTKVNKNDDMDRIYSIGYFCSFLVVGVILYFVIYFIIKSIE